MARGSVLAVRGTAVNWLRPPDFWFPLVFIRSAAGDERRGGGGGGLVGGEGFDARRQDGADTEADDPLGAPDGPMGEEQAGGAGGGQDQGGMT